jgi:hypothetical protein
LSPPSQEQSRPKPRSLPPNGSSIADQRLSNAGKGASNDLQTKFKLPSKKFGKHFLWKRFPQLAYRQDFLRGVLLPKTPSTRPYFPLANPTKEVLARVSPPP